MAHYAFVKQLEVAGTGNALLYAEPFVSDDYFMVIFPDTIYPPETFKDMMTAFAARPSSIIAVHKVPQEDVYKYGVVALDGDRIIDFIEKPAVEDAPSSLIWNGAAILHKDIFTVLKDIATDTRT
ncbi:MAG: sugar phosphate nucleotidyltransferase [bacterium]